MCEYMDDETLNKKLRKKLQKLNFSKEEIENEIFVIDDTTKMLNKYLKYHYNEDLRFAFHDFARMLTHDYPDENDYEIDIVELIKILNDFTFRTVNDEEE